MNSHQNILVADQDDTSRKTLVDWVSAMNGCPFEAKSSEEALGLFRTNPYHIVIADLNLSQMPISELVRSFCAENPNVLVAVSISSLPDEKFLSALRAGARDLLQKPISRTEFESVINRFLGMLQRFQSRQFDRRFPPQAKIELKIPSSGQALIPTAAVICQMFHGLLSRGELLRIELALQEALQNAHEHGNLGIAFHEKATLCNQHQLEEERKRRESSALKLGKQIHVKAKLKGKVFICRITDEGAGFDWQNRAKFACEEKPALSGKSEPKPNDATQLSGRGLVLISQVFDHVEYNAKGNELTLTKKIRYPNNLSAPS